VGRYEIRFSKKASKDYRKLPNEYKSLIDLVLSNVAKEMPADVKPVAGEDNTYRVRIGKYRVLFVVIDNTILISKIGPRGDVYK
jgi:mRNA interferase RelE/StbE